MAESSDLSDLRKRMDGAIDTLKKEFVGLRTGRATPALLEPVKVSAYGSDMPLNQVANINVVDARMLSVQVWDRSLVQAVDKAIRGGGLGLNPVTEGQTVRVPLPELTQERRKELSKLAHKYAEAARVAVRNVRRDGMERVKKLEKDGKLSQDDARKKHDEVQKMTDAEIKRVDEALAAKEKDILQV
ncbi:MAG: ribosome recycling factor [Alphaproteobacteria bacterium]|nr:ribosome recycling factor [Alphaproteobacteria bacterium]